jgi:hypothetical protein
MLEYLKSMPADLELAHCSCAEPVRLHHKGDGALYAVCVHHNSKTPRKDCDYWKWVVRFPDGTAGYKEPNKRRPDRCNLSYTELAKETNQLRRQAYDMQVEMGLQQGPLEAQSSGSYSELLEENEELTKQISGFLQTIEEEQMIAATLQEEAKRVKREHAAMSSAVTMTRAQRR